MLSLFGSMLVEISLPKLIVAWALLLVVPGLLLGLAPIVFVEWLTIVTDKLASLVIGLWSLLILGDPDRASAGSAGARCSAPPRRISGR